MTAQEAKELMPINWSTKQKIDNVLFKIYPIIKSMASENYSYIEYGVWYDIVDGVIEELQKNGYDVEKIPQHGFEVKIKIYWNV